jgi:hypothetical protein
MEGVVMLLCNLSYYRNYEIGYKSRPVWAKIKALSPKKKKKSVW